MSKLAFLTISKNNYREFTNKIILNKNIILNGYNCKFNGSFNNLVNLHLVECDSQFIDNNIKMIIPNKNLFIDNMIYNFTTLDYIHNYLDMNKNLKIHMNSLYFEKFLTLLNDVSKINNSKRLFPLNMNDYINKVNKYDTEYLRFKTNWDL